MIAARKGFFSCAGISKVVRLAQKAGLSHRTCGQVLYVVIRPRVPEVSHRGGRVIGERLYKREYDAGRAVRRLRQNNGTTGVARLDPDDGRTQVTRFLVY